MSKQYLTTHTLDSVHPADIFALAATTTHLLSGSGSSTILVHSIPATSPSAASSPEDHVPVLAQKLEKVHPMGVHHLAAAAEGNNFAASAGFGGEVKLWRRVTDDKYQDGMWELAGRIKESVLKNGAKSTKGSGDNIAGEMWALAMTRDGRYLAASAYDGRMRIWDMLTGGLDDDSKSKGKAKVWEPEMVREYETRGSFGMCIALSHDGKLAASGHENGGVFIFNNDSGRLLHSVTGQESAIRALAFSPASTLLAAGGDAKIIGIYDVNTGEQISILAGHTSWIMSLDFSSTGEWLLSGSYDGKAKVWGMGTKGCVATHGENDKPIWCVKWLPKIGRTEMFVMTGASRSISFYREASGG